jgi:ABC-type proline/glycine betaine transport system permease subunit
MLQMTHNLKVFFTSVICLLLSLTQAYPKKVKLLKPTKQAIIHLLYGLFNFSISVLPGIGGAILMKRQNKTSEGIMATANYKNVVIYVTSGKGFWFCTSNFYRS